MQKSHIKQLDSTDRRILAALESNARATYVEIANQVGLSQTPCTERIKRLEKNGYIEGYQARLNPDLVGRGFMVFIQVTFADSTNDTFDHFRRALHEIDEVIECHMIAGGFDCLLKVAVADMEAYRKVLIDKISDIPGISQTNSYAVIEEIKRARFLLIDEKEAP